MIFSETIAIPDSAFRLSVSPLSFQRNPLIFSRLFYPRHLFFFRSASQVTVSVIRYKKKRKRGIINTRLNILRSISLSKWKGRKKKEKTDRPTVLKDSGLFPSLKRRFHHGTRERKQRRKCDETLKVEKTRKKNER